MMISTRGRYALRVMADLAACDAEEYVPLRDIAKRQEISEKYLESIIKLLVKAEMVTGMRGKGGGYRLAKRPSAVTVAQILEAAEEKLAPVACLEKDSAPCSRMGGCVTFPMWEKLNALVQDFLERITLEDLVREK